MKSRLNNIAIAIRELMRDYHVTTCSADPGFGKAVLRSVTSILIFG